MSSDWPEVKLEDVVSILGDGLHGTPNYDENGEYYFINGNNLGDGKITIDEKTKRASKDEYFKHKKNLNDRTILVSINGTIGNVGLYNGEKVFLGKSACYFNVLEDVDKQFIRYVVTDSNFQNHINSLATGSTIKNVSLRLMRDYAFRLPPLSVQKKISKVLEDLDSKIELNRRMNETLEAIARAIFKSWFVDFDPVRAKASGEPPESICHRLRLTSDLLALFPDRLVDFELGKIPARWEVKPLDVIADHLNGLALQKFPPESDSEWLPVIKIAQLRKGDSIDADRASHNLKSEYIVDDGDVLFSWSGSLGVDIWCGGRGALNQHLFKVTSAKYPKWFYFYWTKHHLLHFQAIAASKAVTMGHIQRKHLTEALCVVPPESLMEKMGDIIAPLLEKQIQNRKTSRTLADVRDTLLPKLLSGELHANHLNNILEEEIA